jgi:1-acyl-sn-glycerol-3-phosphate acyltransferase
MEEKALAPTHHFPTEIRPLKWLLRGLWAFILKFVFFKFYVRLTVKGDFEPLLKDPQKLILISSHSSHLDALALLAAIPYKQWPHLTMGIAKDYFFANPAFSFFSRYCLGAFALDRKDRKREAMNRCLYVLRKEEPMWLLLYPEGTRSVDGRLQPFKRGVSLFSQQTSTPILFLAVRGSVSLWPKGAFFAKPGAISVHVGPIHAPAEIEEIYDNYKSWIETLD